MSEAKIEAKDVDAAVRKVCEKAGHHQYIQAVTCVICGHTVTMQQPVAKAEKHKRYR